MPVTTQAKNPTVKACHERQLTRRTLRYVNRVRAMLGLKPVKYLAKGATGLAESCSIAATLTTKYTSAEVGGSGMEITRYARIRGKDGDYRGEPIFHEELTHPQYVSRWVARFDNGTYAGLKA